MARTLPRGAVGAVSASADGRLSLAGEVVMPKNILVFMDGTRNKPSDERVRKDTNVWKAYKTFGLGDEQTVAKYVRGVGTPRTESVNLPPKQVLENRSRVAALNSNSNLRERAGRFIFAAPQWVALNIGASAVGWGVADRVVEAYAFMSEHYQPGDFVYVFGFSRGAYEARSLVSFAERVGTVLRTRSRMTDPNWLIHQAYDYFRSNDPQSQKTLRLLLRKRSGSGVPRPSASMNIHFVGVWDTVAALGGVPGSLPGKRQTVRQARRWYKRAPLKLVRKEFERLTSVKSAEVLPSNVEHGRHAMAVHELRKNFAPLLWEPANARQTVQQVWFAGAHADVGGGYRETALSDIALDWMLSEAASAPRALMQESAPPTYSKISPAPGTLAPHHEIQGWFSFFDPVPRLVLQNHVAVGSAQLKDVRVHRSALLRLFRPEATDYGECKFEADLPWRTRYPIGVSSALKALDDYLVQFQVWASYPEESSPSSNEARAPFPRQPQPKCVEELRAAEATVLWGPFSSDFSYDVVEAVAILLVFEHYEPCERLIERLVVPTTPPALNAELQNLLPAMRRLPPIVPPHALEWVTQMLSRVSQAWDTQVRAAEAVDPPESNGTEEVEEPGKD